MSQAALRQELIDAIKSAGNKPSTFDAYWPIVLDFIGTTRRLRGKSINRDSITMDDVYAYRNDLAAKRNQSPSSVNQAMSAIRFLFERVLQRDLEQRENDPLRLRQAKRQRRRRISMQQIKSVVDCMRPHDQLVAMLMYGSMSRLDDVLNSRIKDINFDCEQLEISDCKHDHFRIVPLPVMLHDQIRQQIKRVEYFQKSDVRRGEYGVSIPHQYATKCPSATHDLKWYWLFPSRSLSTDPNRENSPKMRWHIDADAYRKRLKAAVIASGTHRQITCHDFRRAGATHFYELTKDLDRLQGILGHNSLEQTKEYIFASEIEISGADSPLAAMLAA